MKKILLLTALSLIFAAKIHSQVNYTTSFDGCSAATCSGWNISGGMSPSITSTSATGYSPCNTASAKSNIYSSSTTTTLTSGLLGNSNGLPITFSFSGKALTYSTGVAAAAGACTFTGYWSTDGSTWTAINSINNLSSTSCNTYTFNQFTPSLGSNVYVRIVAVRNSGDFWAVMDDISVIQETCAPSVSITQNCNPDLSYSIDINVTSLNGASGVDIRVGTTTYHWNVGVGTYTISSLVSGVKVIVRDHNDHNCKYEETINACPCTNPTATFTKTCAGDNSYYNVSINVTNIGSGPGVNITDGTTNFYTNVGTGVYNIPNNFTNNKIFYVQNVNNANCFISKTFGVCNVCVNSPTPLPHDECSGAPLIDLAQPFAGSTSCSYTPSAGSPTGCGSIENDSWMRFIAADTEVTLEFEVSPCFTGGGTYVNPATDYAGIQLYVFSGNCASLTAIPGSCVNPITHGSNAENVGTWNFSGLTIGATYYIRIDGYAGQRCDYWFTPIAGVVVTPDNDVCANAHALSCGDSHTASIILATAIDQPPVCSGGGASPTGKGVWYTFTGDGSDVTISTNNPGTNFDTRINVYSGTCGSLTCVGADISSGAGTTSELTISSIGGTQYYIYVSGNGASEGQFEISIECTELLEPTITSQPTNQTVCSTTAGTAFSISADNATGYQWQINSSGWTNLSNGGVYSGATTSTLAISNVSGLIGAEYRCVVSNATGSINSDVVTIINSQSIGGEATGGSTICSGSNSGLLSLINHTGNITQWQYSTNSGANWLNIENTSATYTSGALTQTTWFRAEVQNGTCATAFSSHTVVSVNPTSAVGIANVSASPICHSSATSVSIASATGSIQWQQSPNGTDSWINAVGGSGATTLTYTTPNLTATTFYRAVVTSGVCTSVNSNVVEVTVTPATVGGSVTGGAAVCSGFNSPELTLSGHTGSVVKWQSSTNSGTLWIDIEHTGTTYTSGALTQTTWFRAVVKNGVCNEVNSNHTVVTVNALPTTSGISGNDTPACNAAGIIYNVTNTAGSTYSWGIPAGATIVAGDGTNQISVNFGSTNGNISVVETNSNSCVGAQQILAISLQGCGLNANFSANNTTVCTGADVVFTNTSTGTTGTTTYSWNFGAGASPATANGVGPHTVTYSTGGNKTVSLTITDGASDTETKADYITVNPFPAAAGTISGTSTVCATTNGVSYSVAAIANATAYVWNYSGTGATINGSGSSITINFASNATSGNLIVHGTNSCGSGATSTNFPITVNPLPTATIAGTNTLCTGQDATITVTLTGSQPWSITYLRDGANAQTVTGITTSPYTFTTTTAGNYTLSAVSDVNCTGTFSGIATIAFNALPNATISGTATICQGSNATISVALTGTQPWSITYQRDGANNVTVNDITMSPYTFQTPTSGTYTISAVSDANCTGTFSGNAVITVNPTSVGGTASAANSPICLGSSTSITLSGHIGAVQWQQSPNGTDSWINAVGGSGATTATYTTPTLTSTTYYRALVTSGVCSSINSTVAQVVVNPTSAVGSISVTTTPVCFNSNTTISITSATGSIQWQQSANGTDGWVNVIGGSGANSLAYTTPMLTETTYYRAIVTSGECSSVASAVAQVEVTPATVGGTVSGGASICSGFNSPELTINGHTGSILTWQYSHDGSEGSWVSIPGTAGLASYTSGALTQTTWFNAVVKNGVCPSVESSSTIVTVNSLPSTSVISGSQTPACGAVGEVYSVELTSGSSYAWTVPAGATIVSGATGPNNNEIVVDFASNNGFVRVTENNGNGCVGTQQNLEITLQGCALNANFIANTTSTCVGNTVVFTNLSSGTTGTTTYNWDFGTDATPATANTAGPHNVTYSSAGQKTVSLTITDGASDTETKSNYITVNPFPAASGDISGSEEVCQGSSLIGYSVSPIAEAISYNWAYSGSGVTINGSGSNITISFATNATSGNLNVYATNACGNGMVSADFPITVNPLPQPPSSVSASSNIICPNGTTILSYTGGSGDVFNWYSGSCGGELVGSGNNLEQQIETTTTFFGRWENGCGTSTCQQITVIAADNLAPVPNIATLPVINAECEVSELTAPTATDNCSGAIVGTHTITLPITSSTVIVWTYTDAAGNSSTQSQNVVINDVTPPVVDIAELPELTDECSITHLVVPTATDNCSGSVTGTHNVSLPITSSTTITWTYTDASGNSSTQLQNVIINDTTAPVPNVEVLEDLVINCSHLFVELPSATDNCEGTIFAYTADPLYYDEPGSYLITWVYEDSSGNFAEQPQWLTITNEEPVALTKDITIELSENGTASIATQDIDDGSYDDCDIESISIDISEFNESNVGNNIVTLTITDNVGNTASETAIVTVIDPRIMVKIPNFISPNNDGINDFWEIEGVELLSGYNLIIFDKYGKVVYSTTEYDNSWNARYNNQDLPDGTYFYHFSKDKSHYKGFISVVR